VQGEPVQPQPAAEPAADEGERAVEEDRRSAERRGDDAPSQ
jgi:hypothetical protein